MSKWNLIIDVADCTNCQLCALAAMDEYVGNVFPGYAAPMPRHGHRWIDILAKERGQAPMIDIAYVPTCAITATMRPASRRRRTARSPSASDGIVIIDPVKATGQRELVDACPYGHIWWNEELQIPQHWPFDAHLIDQGWQQTRGHQSCPTGAMRAVKIDDEEMARMVREERPGDDEARARHRPRVYYRNLWRYAQCFIGGTVSAEANGVVDCVEGAHVRLIRDGAVVAETATDNYGDFKFDRLDENSGAYTVEIEAPGYAKRSVEPRCSAKASRSARSGSPDPLPRPRTTMLDQPTPLVIPALGAVYATLAPIVEALLRVVVGLTLVPHGLRITFGCFAGSGLGVTNLKGLAAELDQAASVPGGCGRRRSRSPSSCAGRCSRSACSHACGGADRHLPCACPNIERWRVGGFFWNTLGLEYTLMWTVAALFFLDQWRRRLFARPSPGRP